jgi:hypothetical protein
VIVCLKIVAKENDHRQFVCSRSIVTSNEENRGYKRS